MGGFGVLPEAEPYDDTIRSNFARKRHLVR